MDFRKKSGLKKENDVPEMRYIKLPYEKANKYLAKVFEKLENDDFHRDRFLEIFIKQFHNYVQNIKCKKERAMQYKKFQIKGEIMPGASVQKLKEEFANEQDIIGILNLQIPDLITYYIDTVCKNTPYNKTETVVEICSHLFPTGEFKIGKKHILTVLSSFFQRSNITFENEDQINDMSEAVHEELYNNIKNEIKAEYGENKIKQRKNEKAEKMEQNARVYTDTEKKCDVLRKNPKMEKLQKSRVYIARANDADGATGLYTVESRFVEIINYEPKPINTPHNPSCKISVCNRPATQELYKPAQNMLYIMGGSQMIAGGRANQGIESNELYISMISTYCMAISEAAELFPCNMAPAVILIPEVWLFKDPKQYNILTAEKAKIISVANLLMPVRPETNIECQDTNEMDKRLFLPSTKMKEKYNLAKKLEMVFSTTRHKNIIIDDLGIFEFWLPPHEIAGEIKSAIERFKSAFDTITVCVENKELYKIYNSIIM